MIGLTFRDISWFSGINPSVNTTIPFNFGTLFICLHHTNKENISAKNYIITLQNEGIHWYHTLSHDDHINMKILWLTNIIQVRGTLTNDQCDISA